MAKVTSKLQLTLPKAIAEQYGIRPGDDLNWLPAGDAIRVVKRNAAQPSEPATLRRRMQLFDEATARQAKRENGRKYDKTEARPADRGWSREELYSRGLPH